MWTSFRNDSHASIFVQSPKTEFSVAAHITYVVKYQLIKIAIIQVGHAEAALYQLALSDAALAVVQSPAESCFCVIDNVVKTQ